MTGGSAESDITEIARHHYDAVFRFCARRVGVDRAADVSQETFLTAQRALHRFRGDSNLRTWLFGIAHNECRRMSRRQRCEPLLLDMDPERPANAETEDSILDRHALSLALAKLSPEHREVVMLHEVEGLTYEEAATVLGVPTGTVKSRLHHAFLQLRRTLFTAEEAAL